MYRYKARKVIATFEPGDKVHWTDPDDDIASGPYTVEEVKGDHYVLVNDQGSVTEAFEEELKKESHRARRVTGTLKCQDCGNDDKFTVTGIEHHTWLVDKHGNFIEDYEAGGETAEAGDDFQCVECDSYNVGTP